MLKSLAEGNTVCKGIYMHTLHSGFLHDVSITLIDKTDPSCFTKSEDYWIDTLKTKPPMGLNFDFDDSFQAYCLIFLHLCYWVLMALFLDLRFWISGVFMFLNFVTDFIQICYCIAVVIFISIFIFMPTYIGIDR